MGNEKSDEQVDVSRLEVSKDALIILKKTHTNQLRRLLQSNFKLNDVLYRQAKELGISE